LADTALVSILFIKKLETLGNAVHPTHNQPAHDNPALHMDTLYTGENILEKEG
jgi:hypothetical protein